MPLTFGYARVSTDGQTLEAQFAQLEAAGAKLRRVFRQKVSGAKGVVAQPLSMWARAGTPAAHLAGHEQACTCPLPHDELVQPQ